MKNLRKRFDVFCYQNRHKGIPNLMLFVAITSGVIYLLTMITQNYAVEDALEFNRALILQGQVWRLLTWVVTKVFSFGDPFSAFLSLYFMYVLGRALEMTWGTLRFNLYYLSGILFMDLFAMVLGGVVVEAGDTMYYADYPYSEMAVFLHLSLLIAYATAYPDNSFVIFFIIPVKARILAVIYLGITLLQVVMLSYPLFFFPHNLFPLVAFANYFLFVGRDIRNLFPFWRRKASKPKPVFVKINPEKKAQAAYTHKCVLCGKTDVSNPEMEFRYCSRCNGYFCYCQDHINNHTHVE